MRNINSIFKKRQLNSSINRDGIASDDLERFFADNFDDKIIGFVEKFQSVRGAGPSVNVTSSEHRFFVQCLYNLMKRTPEFHEPVGILEEIERIIPEAVNDYQREVRPLSANEIAGIFNEEAKKRIIQNARVDVLRRQASAILNLLAERQVCFAYPASERKSFIISSQPVLRMTNNKDANLRTGDVELWVPLTPKFAAGLLTQRNARNVFPLTDSFVRHMNISIFQNSISIASQSEALLKSLIAFR